MGKFFPVLALTCALCTGVELAAVAAPTVDVRARTAIALDAVRRLPGGIQVSGRVVDANTGEPIPGAAVQIAVAGFVEVSQTNDEGRFSVPFEVVAERLDLLVQASGPSLSQSRAEIAGLEVSKRPLELSLDVGPVTANEVTLVVRAGSEGIPTPGLEIPVTLDGDALTTLRTDPSGRAEARLSRQGALGQPGRKSFTASFPGSELYDPASATTTELMVVATTLEFSIEDLDVRFSDTVRGRGALLETGGRALRDARVDLVAATGDVLNSAVTDEAGQFEFDVEAEELGPGDTSLQVVFESPQPWFESTRSKTLTVSVAEPEPIPMGYTLGAFGVTAIALLAFVGLRTKPWLRWRSPEDADDGTDRALPRTRPVAGGLKPSRQSLISTIRRAHDFGFSAIVRDAATGRPIPGATLHLDLGDEGRQGASDAAGAVGFEDLAEGLWSAQARSPHYVTESFAVTIPHRGELRGAHIDLVPVRERIFDMYRDAALPHLPRPALWGIWTPRQIIDRVKRSSPAPALSRLTDFVEDAYFSQRTPLEDVLPVASQLVADAIAEAGRQPSL